MNQYKEKKVLLKKKESTSRDLSNKNNTNKKISSKKISKSHDLNNKKHKMAGGGDVIGASINIINSMEALGKSIFDEIRSIQSIPTDINNVASVKSIPNNNLEVKK
jgi:hypothetical protein